jgi:hypothetical protein
VDVLTPGASFPARPAVGVTLALAIGAGAGIALAPPAVAVALIVAVVGAVSIVAFRPDRFLEKVGLALAAVGLLSITFNGVRLSSFATASDVFLAASAVILVPPGLARGRGVPGWLIVASGAIVLTGVLSALASTDSVSEQLIPALEFGGVIVFVPLLISTMGRYRTVALLLVGSAALNSAVAVTDFIAGTEIGPTLTGFQFLGRTGGLAIHPNHLAVACAIAAPLAAYLVMTAATMRVRTVAAACGIFILAGILVSGSRAGLLAGFAGVVVMLVIGHRVVDWRAVLAIAAVAAAGLLVIAQGTSATVAFDRLTGAVSIGDSDAIRGELYGEAIARFVQSPVFGMGFADVRESHDIYLQMLQAGGLIGLFGLLTLFGGGVRSVVLTSPLSVAAIGALAAWAVAGLAQNLVYDRFLYVPVGMLIGVAWERARPGGAAVAGALTGTRDVAARPERGRSSAARALTGQARGRLGVSERRKG